MCDRHALVISVTIRPVIAHGTFIENMRRSGLTVGVSGGLVSRYLALRRGLVRFTNEWTWGDRDEIHQSTFLVGHFVHGIPRGGSLWVRRQRSRPPRRHSRPGHRREESDGPGL